MLQHYLITTKNFILLTFYDFFPEAKAFVFRWFFRYFFFDYSLSLKCYCILTRFIFAQTDCFKALIAAQEYSISVVVKFRSILIDNRIRMSVVRAKTTMVAICRGKKKQTVAGNNFVAIPLELICRCGGYI